MIAIAVGPRTAKQDCFTEVDLLRGAFEFLKVLSDVGEFHMLLRKLDWLKGD